MRCPSCNREIVDPDARFCPHCDTSLASTEGSATVETEIPSAIPLTAEVRAEEVATGEVPLRRRLTRPRVWQPWADSAGAAAFGFLALLVCGAVLLLAGRLQYPGLGAGSNPISVLTAAVIVALGSLRVPIDVGGLELTALPLGVIAVFGWALAWAARRVVARHGRAGLAAGVWDGARAAVPFALLCFVAALVFRLRGGTTPVGADPGVALVLGLIWGALFGALGGLTAQGPARELWSRAGAALARMGTVASGGVPVGVAMIVLALGLGTLAAFAWVIAALATGSPAGSLTAGKAGAALIYLAAFGPNVVVALVSVSLGASLRVGAQVGIGGRLIGDVQEFSLLSWGPGGPPWYAFLTIAIPVVGFGLAGAWARRSWPSSLRIVERVGVAAGIAALGLATLAWLGHARLGAGLVRSRGFGVVSPDAPVVLVAAFAWAFVFGLAGWYLEDRRAARRRPEETTAEVAL